MKIFVKRFDTTAECKSVATKFVVFVVNLFEEHGYELNERIVWPTKECLWIDSAYLHNWNVFQKQQ